MKKIISGKLYNTDTATNIGCSTASCSPRDFSYWCETLFRKRTGEFFLHGEGGPMTRYAERVDSNSWCGGEKILPLSFDEAREWAEKNLTADEYEAAFGAVVEDDSTTVITLSMAASTVEQARRSAAAAGLSLSAYIASLIK